MLKTLREIPEIEDGYLLEVDKGWFSVVKPVAKTNLIPNPNFLGVGLYGANFGTLPENYFVYNATVQSTLAPLFTPTALLVTPNTSTSIARLSYRNDGAMVGEYTFSVYVKGVSYNQELILSMGSVSKTVKITPEYRRYFIKAILPTGTTSTTVNVSSQGEFTTTAWQLEQGNLTTFFSGDTRPTDYDGDDAYTWIGTQFESPSVRSEKAYSGGELIPLKRYGFNVLAVEGLGVPELSPIIYEQSLYNEGIYAGSNIGERSIGITGIINSSSFSDLQKSLGEITNLVYNIERPVRIYFTPYEWCDDDNVTSIFFDFLYTDGLNDEIEALYGLEFTIEGISYTPCLFSSSEYTFNTVNMNDFVVENNTIVLINNDNQIIEAPIPFDFEYGNVNVVDAKELAGRIYAIIEVGPSYFLVSYGEGGWRNIAESPQQTDIVGALSPTLGALLSLEVVESGDFEGVWVGGYFLGLAIIPGPNVTEFNTGNNRYSLFRFNHTTNQITYHSAEHQDYLVSIGSVNTIRYNKRHNTLWFGGAATRFIYAPNGSTSGALGDIHVAQLRKINGVYSFNSIAFPYDQNSVAFTRSSHWPLNANIPQIFTVYYDEQRDRLYIGTNTYEDAYNVETTTQAYFYVVENALEINGDRENVISTFPFNSRDSANLQSGAIFNITPYGNDGALLVSGRFTQANSDFNNTEPNGSSPDGTGYEPDADYLSAVAVYKPRAYNNAATSSFIYAGNFQPLGNTVNSNPFTGLSIADKVYGVYYTDGNTPPPIEHDTIAATFSEFHGSIVVSGSFNYFGDSVEKQDGWGFAEYLPLSQSEPNKGVWVMPTMYLENNTILSSATFRSFNNTPNIKALIAANEYSLYAQGITYNAGVKVEMCNNVQQVAELILIAANPVKSIHGIRNLTTGAKIYFEPFDVRSETITMFSYNGNTITVEDNAGLKFAVNDDYNNGNPLLVKNGDIIQLLFDLSSTVLTPTSFIPSSLSVVTRNCHLSYGQALTC